MKHSTPINGTKPTEETELYENLISTNFIDYIKNDQLLDLPLPAINRILTKYQLKNQNQTGKEVIDFLFKCIGKYGRSASVLFQNIDFKNEESKYLQRLLTEYSDIFDFHFINKACFKNMYEIENDLIKKIIELKISQTKMCDSIQEENKQLKNEIEKMTKIQEETKNVIKNLESNFNKKIDQLTNTINNQNNFTIN